MAVEHMVWIRFHDDISDERRQAHLDGLRGLARHVPGIERVVVGENFTDRAQGFTHGLLVRLTDRQALATYQDHPAHVAVAAPLKEDADLMAMDIETDQPA